MKHALSVALLLLLLLACGCAELQRLSPLCPVPPKHAAQS